MLSTIVVLIIGRGRVLIHLKNGMSSAQCSMNRKPQCSAVVSVRKCVCQDFDLMPALTIRLHLVINILTGMTETQVIGPRA